MIKIDGKICECDESESILNVARRNGIYIPAICYLNGCSPTLACRLCMVEAGGKVVYSCNAKAKDGLEVLTHTKELNDARRAIMQTYCINHPLECGVCDKSGECELQNLTHYSGVNEVTYAIKDTHKPTKNWGFIEYEPSLCIVCERCVTSCKDRTGEERLKTVPRGGDQVPKELKETMQKDAFAVWSKLQKSLIDIDGDALECSECGECVAVCPTGALVDSHFTYSSNAWELEKIPSSNPHSSDCELIYYEVKRSGIENREPKIYRVSSDFHFSSLNKAARYGFDFHNSFGKKEPKKLEELANFIKNGEIKNIKFNSFITNEEAKILEILRAEFGLNLVNKEALLYQEFLKNFTAYSGKSLYSGDIDAIKEADFIVVAGSFIRHDSPNLSYAINNALRVSKASGLYFHPIKDGVVEKFSKNFLSINHSPNLDIEILLFLLEKFGENLPEFLEFQDVSDKISEILDLESFEKISAGKNSPVLIIGEDFIRSKNSQTLAKLTGLIERHTNFKTLIIPPRTNSLGVAKICTLSSELKAGKTLGYNEKAEFEMGIFGGLELPALNQQEGTFLNLDKRVVPLNRALPFYGYELNDLANALGVGLKNTIDQTPNLGDEFKGVKFDDLKNFYDNAGKNHRGYKMEILDSEISTEPFSLENLNDSFENFIYLANPIAQFSKFSSNSTLLNEVAYFYAGAEFIEKFELESSVKIGEISLMLREDKDINSAYIPYFDEKIPVDEIFTSRFIKAESFLKAKRGDE